MNTEFGAQVFTDESRAYAGLNRPHRAVKHSVGELLSVSMAHTNGLESFWSMLKWDHDGAYRHFSAKRVDRYVTEFEGRHKPLAVGYSDEC